MVKCRPGTSIDFERVLGYTFERYLTVKDTGMLQFDQIRVLLALMSRPFTSLDQAGRLENAAYTQWVAHSIQG